MVNAFVLGWEGVGGIISFSFMQFTFPCWLWRQ